MIIEEIKDYQFNDNIKPCPECGGMHFEMYRANRDVVLLDEEYQYDYWIFCKDCGYENMDAYGETEHEAEMLWNEKR